MTKTPERQPGEEAAKDVRVNLALGQIVSTPGALKAFTEAGVPPYIFLARHQQGDWGQFDKEDWQLNDMAVQDGGRIFSAYVLPTGVKIWIITEWDRSVTTFLLPSEY